jgi:hypothetical protein
VSQCGRVFGAVDTFLFVSAASSYILIAQAYELAKRPMMECNETFFMSPEPLEVVCGLTSTVHSGLLPTDAHTASS